MKDITFASGKSEKKGDSNKMDGLKSISTNIVTDPYFLTLSISEQALYFFLLLYSDQDGYVNAYKVIDTIKYPEETLDNLIRLGFIKIIDDKKAYITDWEEHIGRK